MSIQPLEDPGQAFLDEGWQPTPSTVVEDSPDLLKIAAEMAAVFVVGRVLTKAYLARRTPSSPVEAEEVSNDAWKAIAPMWMQVAIPAVMAAYRFGAERTVPYAQLEEMAIDYATEMGEYIHRTSTEAVVEGFTSQLVAGTQPSVAWPRAIEGYGLDRRQMRAYMSTLAKQTYSAEIVPPQARESVQRAVMTRADLLGTNEAFRATQVGRNISWIILASSGDLPAGTQKMWITAEDERVCPVCAPLDRVTIPLHWKFESGGMRFLAPGVHPNCRCTLELIYPEFEDIVKAMPGDPYDRDSEGQFASFESRKAKPKEKSAFEGVFPEKESAFGVQSSAFASLSGSLTDALRSEIARADKQSQAFAEAMQGESVFAAKPKSKLKSWTVVVVRNADGTTTRQRVEGSAKNAEFYKNFGGRVYWDATEFLASTGAYDRWLSGANSRQQTNPVILDLDERSSLDGDTPNIYRARGRYSESFRDQDVRSPSFLDAITDAMPAVSSTEWAGTEGGQALNAEANLWLTDADQLLSDTVESDYEYVIHNASKEDLLKVVWDACENAIDPASYEDLGNKPYDDVPISSFKDVQELDEEDLKQRLTELYFFQARDNSTLRPHHWVNLLNQQLFAPVSVQRVREQVAPGMHMRESAYSQPGVTIPIIVRFDDFWGVPDGAHMEIEGKYRVTKMEMLPLIPSQIKGTSPHLMGSMDLLKERINERDDITASQKDQILEDAKALGAVYVATVEPISRSALAAKQESFVRNEGWRD